MQRTCTLCSASFEITDDDLAFYDRVAPIFNGKKESIPPPTLCPQCRRQRRLSFRNERNLYFRTCSLTGKRIFATHTPDAAFPVYDVSEWVTDDWDPLIYGRDFDFNRPFFDQLKDLRDSAPHYSLYTDYVSNVNSDFTNCIANAKNCYLTTNATFVENCYYSRGISYSKDCSDCLRGSRCELCYECIDAHNCYRCLYLQDCDTCSECSFSTGLRRCTYCIGCHGLVQREYCAFNQQLTKEEWMEKYGSKQLTRPVIAETIHQSEALRLSIPQRFASLIQCENVTGDRCIEAKNCKEIFDCNKMEDCAYCTEITDGLKDSRDCSMWGEQSELFYECNAAGTTSLHCLFCDQIWKNNRDLYYCIQCFPSTTDCFGCFSLHRQKFCILNKQYAEEEYNALVPKIIDHMRSTGEWGEFFPNWLSDYAYNQSLANEFYPLTQAQVQERGWRWYREPAPTHTGTALIPPNRIVDTSDDICNAVLTCEQLRKPFKVIDQEVKFYRSMDIPVPTLCPDARHMNRMAKRRPCFLWERSCMKCGKEIQTNYQPPRPEIVYCEECYLQAVY